MRRTGLRRRNASRKQRRSSTGSPPPLPPLVAVVAVVAAAATVAVAALDVVSVLMKQQSTRMRRPLEIGGKERTNIVSIIRTEHGRTSHDGNGRSPALRRRHHRYYRRFLAKSFSVFWGNLVSPRPQLLVVALDFGVDTHRKCVSANRSCKSIRTLTF